MTVATKPNLPASDPQADIPDVPIYRLTVAQYHAMARAGILEEDAPVELLEGWLVRRVTKHRPHVLATGRVRRSLESLIRSCWYVAHQDPISTADSEPEPDLSVIRGEEDDYLVEHPGPADVGLVVEVADSSLRQDRGPKKRLYAAAAIPIYWIVNIKARQIEIYTDPDSSAKRPDYRQRHDYRAEHAIPVVLAGVEVGRLAVRELLP